MKNEELLRWAQATFDVMAGNLDQQIKLALIIATCLRTQLLSQDVKEVVSELHTES